MRWVKGTARRASHSVARFGEGAARLDVAAAELLVAEVGVVDEEMGGGSRRAGQRPPGVGSGRGRAAGCGKAPRSARRQ
jgi:hypothetical protein